MEKLYTQIVYKVDCGIMKDKCSNHNILPIILSSSETNMMITYTFLSCNIIVLYIQKCKHVYIRGTKYHNTVCIWHHLKKKHFAKASFFSLNKVQDFRLSAKAAWLHVTDSKNDYFCFIYSLMTICL